jgi:hypothetical protein
MQNVSDITPGKPRNRRRRAHVSLLGAAAIGIGIAVAAALPAGQVGAAIDPSSPGTTTAHVDVGSEILLSNLTQSFSLVGFPGDQPEDIGAVTMNVETNNSHGYNVTVAPEAPVLSGTGTNPDTIPVTDLSVRETAEGNAGAYTPLSGGTPPVPVTVHNQLTRSAAAPGDLLSNDYEFNVPIPNVRTDTYSVILDYVATTNP